MMEKQQLAVELYNAGAIQFGAYQLKMHEEHPDAPLSPIYINLRMPPKGVLTEETIEKIGTALYEETLGQS